MKQLAVVLLGAAAFADACSSGSASRAAVVVQPPPSVSATPVTVPSATSTTLTIAAAGQEYLAIIGPANTALDKFNSQLQNLSASATGPDVQKVAAPAVAAIDRALQQLARVAWPTPAIKTDADAVISADSVVAADLSNFQSQTAFSISAFANQLAADGGKAHGAVTILRADLGLPPPGS